MTATVTPSDIIAFWSEAGPELWFAKDDAFDRRFRDMFLQAHESAARGDLDHWQRTPGGAIRKSPAWAMIVSSPSVNVASPSRIRKTSS